MELELELDFDSVVFPYAAIFSVLSDKTEEPLINKQIFFFQITCSETSATQRRKGVLLGENI